MRTLVSLFWLVTIGWFPVISSGEQQAITAETRLPAKFATEETNGEAPHWRYLLHLPTGYEQSKTPWPLMIYLHGRSIRGNDLNMVKRYGPPTFLDKKPDFPFVVVAPQLPDHSWPSQSLLELLDEVTAKYRVDPDRIYLTGVSMGGGGSWYLAAADADRFAALAPLCGYGGTSLAKKLTNLPIWAFHGALDELVPIEPHQKLVDAVNAAGGNARFTVIPDGDHGNIIFPTYKRDDLYQWMLAQKRGQKAVMPPEPNPAPQPAPAPAKPIDTYRVQKGDTLWKISKNHGITVDQLMKANQLDKNLIKIDQELIIPK